MIIQKTSILKIMRFLCIFCAIGIGFIPIVGCSSDDAADVVSDIVDVDFEEDADLELSDVATDNSSESVSAMAAGDECNTTSINTEIDAIEDEIEGLSAVSIESVTLRSATATYNATWDPATATSLICSLTITGDLGNATIGGEAFNQQTGTITVNDQATLDVINNYLSNRDEQFTFCAICSDTTGIDTYSVTYSLLVSVTITGNI